MSIARPVSILGLAALSLLAPVGCAEKGDGCTPNSDLEIETNDLINDHRQGMGLTELRLSGCASEIARVHSEDMAAGRVPFSHDGFDQRAEEVMAVLPGVTAVGENVAWLSAGFPQPAEAAVQGWLDSEGHRANIETAEFNTSGMAVVEDESGGLWFTHLLIAAAEE